VGTFGWGHTSTRIVEAIYERKSRITTAQIGAICIEIRTEEAAREG